MKRFLKSSLSLILAITIIFSSAIAGFSEIDFSGLFAVKAQAASSGNCGDNLTWTLDDDGVLTISGEGVMMNYSFPEDVPWYSLCSSIKSVVINSGVKSIGSEAFNDCTSLTSITIPDSITSIGSYSFRNCTNLTSITIPECVTSIGSSAFWGCARLTSITIPNSVTSIGDSAFVLCTRLTSITVDSESLNYSSVDGVLFNKAQTTLIRYPEGKTNTTYTIPDGVISICDKAFIYCRNLMSITISNSVTSIGNRAFYSCDFLYTIRIPDSVTSICEGAFLLCENLTSITIPDSVTSIGAYAFYYTAFYDDESNWENSALYIGNHLIRVENTISGGCFVKNGTKTIADAAFESCEFLYTIRIPDSVTSIGGSAFDSCTNLTTIKVDLENPNYSSLDGVLFNKTQTTLVRYPIGTTKFTYTIPNSVTSIGDFAFRSCPFVSIEIPDSVTSIGKRSFSYCEKLSSITLPNGVTSIGDSAFDYCKSLTSITIPNSVTSIGDSAFYYCKSLTSITIPNSVTSIGDSAFDYCERLTSITIPNSVTSIGGSAFDCCYRLTSITVDSENLNYSSVDGVLFNKAQTILIQYPAGKANTAYTVPDGVISIVYSAFKRCDNLALITIPDTVTSIDAFSFSGCSSLASITIPGSVTSIGSYAFSDCTSLVSITIPSSVTGIASNTFSNCTSLTSITIPDSVTSIGASAFYGCYNLEEVYYGGARADWAKILIGSGNGFLTNTKIHYHEHIYSSEWIVDIKPTCTETGSKHSACLECGDTVTEEISAIGHSYNEWTIVVPSCTEDGSKYRTCSVCNDVETVKLPSEGHSYSTEWTIDVVPSCTDDGLKHKVCSVCDDVITEVIPQLKPATPKLTKIANTASGVKVTWGKVTGADNYVVYRKTYNAKTKKWGGWANLGKTTSTSYVDKTAKSGTYYLYTVRANNEAGLSGYNTSGIKTYFLGTPKISSTANASNAITVKWAKITGATGYIVYRKEGNGGWKNLGKTTGTSFTDKTAKSGVTYKYTVKAYYSSYVSAYNTSGTAIRRLTTPTLKSVTSAKAGVTFKWNKVTGATGYYVYRKTGNGSWVKLATVTGNSKITYLDKTAKKGVTYKYTVKAYYGTSTSAYNTKGLTIKDKY